MTNMLRMLHRMCQAELLHRSGLTWAEVGRRLGLTPSGAWRAGRRVGKLSDEQLRLLVEAIGEVISVNA